MPFCIGWVENFDKVTLSCTVKKIEANFCFSIFGKNSKIQNGRHFWEEEIFLKIAKSTFLRYPMGRKFQNQFCVLPFWAKIRKFKMAAICGRVKFFENCKEYISRIPYGSKISTKSLYLARLRR